MTEQNNLYGIWKNGWCSFKKKVGSVYTFLGTYEEALDGARILNDDCALAELAYFDHMRDPKATMGNATAIRVEALEYINEYGTQNRHPKPKNWTVSIQALIDYGWICLNVTSDGKEHPTKPVRLTKIGLSILNHTACDFCGSGKAK